MIAVRGFEKRKSSRQRMEETADIEEKKAAESEEEAINPLDLLFKLQEERVEIDRIIKSKVRTKRVSVVMAPELHERTKAIAFKDGISVNEFINRALEDVLTVREQMG